ncbi:hypothetical protein [Candidatus Magnetominusculus xianensis]|uniref:Secreted protein n=1 Tax=Candidatus Magnetominusculus xianensis TaxID=1748249 RepID=A0ABR5SIG1_9BACT|nr:hypothetical protein [Candidatus Magnetominusculus xianensis]KWT92681.1 hypothetical protein ASN18_0512 [Candidatus Magnetominusculus xianensis]MBF0403768.1 hypothetical protein [Nitrospirota bacterium]
MLTQKTTKTLIILTIVLFAFSHADGDSGIYCVSLKRFSKHNKLFRRVRGFDFQVNNAEIHSIPGNPLMGLAIDNNKNYFGTYNAYCPGGPCGCDVKYFYDNFVIIKKRPSVNLDKVRIKFSFTVEQESINDKGDEIDDGEVTYDFTNKDLNIKKCKGRPY